MADFDDTPDHDTIAQRAHELYEARGGDHGFDLEDWVAAEQELTNAESEAPEYAEVIPLAGESDTPGDDDSKRAPLGEDSAKIWEDRGEE